MHKLKKISLILGLLSSFVTIYTGADALADDKSTNAADDVQQKLGNTYPARIATPKAIVYADENMNSPLGFISNGKLIIVGNPRKLNRELVPLVVHGRLAFIQIKDIRYETDEGELITAKNGAPKEHDVDIVIKPPDEKLSENNSAYLSINNFFTGDELKSVFQSIDGEEKSSMLGLRAQFIHRKEFSRYFWGAGFDYSFISSDGFSFGYFMINPTLGMTLMRNPLFLLDVYGSLDFSVTTFTDVKNNYENESGGFVWGPQISTRLVFFPENKYHIEAGMGLKRYRVMEIEQLTDKNDNTISGFTHLIGMNFFLGVGIEL